MQASSLTADYGFPNKPSREQASTDGTQVDVTKTAQQAGIRIPVLLTRTVFDAYVAVPKGIQGQDEAGRLWDICWMLRFAILRSHSTSDKVAVGLYVRNDHRRAKLVKLIAQCGPLDLDNPQPAFAAAMLAKPRLDASVLDSDHPQFSYESLASHRLEITYRGHKEAYTQQHKIDGQPVNYQSYPLFGNPWVSQLLNGNELTIKHGETIIIYDFNRWAKTETRSSLQKN